MPPNNSLDRVNKQHLELITEVRSLTYAVSQLHLVFVKRRVLFWCIGILAGLVLVLGGGGGALIWTQHNDVKHLVTKLVDGCQVRNKQAAGTAQFIRGNVKLQDESAKINGEILAQLNLHFTPEQAKEFAKLAGEEKRLLNHWKKTQPGPIHCDLAK
jgi:hypothetical protein